MSSISKNVTDELLRPAAQTSKPQAKQISMGESEADTEGGSYSTGILPSQALRHQVNVSKEILALEPILDNQFQPASLDLRLGPVAYRVRASFLPGKNVTVKQKLEEFAMHEMDITKGGCWSAVVSTSSPA